MNWEPYDPSWLVRLARAQEPDESWLPLALSHCTSCCWRGRAYVYFVDPSNANEPGADWQFKENIALYDASEGELLLDILRDGRVGGIEFLSRL